MEDKLVLSLTAVPIDFYCQWVDRPEAEVRQHLARLGVAIDDSVAKRPLVNMHEVSNAIHRYLERQ